MNRKDLTVLKVNIKIKISTTFLIFNLKSHIFIYCFDTLINYNICHGSRISLILIRFSRVLFRLGFFGSSLHTYCFVFCIRFSRHILMKYILCTKSQFIYLSCVCHNNIHLMQFTRHVGDYTGFIYVFMGR